MSIAGKTVAVTGAARGIGAAIAEELARRGALVALGDLDHNAAQRTAEGCAERAVGLALDVTDTGSFRAFLDEAERHFDRPLDVLVNNAGIMWVGRYDEEPEVAAHRQMEVNFHGVARGMRLALPRMRERGHGHVVTVASASSKLPTAGEATYSATKHAVYGYSAAVREELRGSGVDISVVMPVVVETELAAGTSHGRGVRLAPADVATVVAATIARPRFEVYVPRNIAVWSRLVALAPQPVRDRLYDAMMPNQIRDGNTRSREGYEQRQVLK